MTNKKILGVIPARGGSKGVPQKNIHLVNEKPLIAYAIECALQSSSLDQVIVSTDNFEISEISKKWGASVPFIRPAKLAKDTSPMFPVIYHALIKSEKYFKTKFDCVVVIDPTAPLRIVDDIEKALEKFLQSNCDALVSGNNSHRNPYFNMVKKNRHYVTLVNTSKKPIERRQDAPKIFDLNTVVWIFSRDSILKQKGRLPKRTILYLVPNDRAIDLDTECDFQYLEFLLNKKNLSHENHRL